MRELLKTIKNQIGEHFLFVGATILSAGIHFIFSIYVKAYVEPLEYGIYSTCILLQTYMAYLQLGSLNAFNRDYPQLVGAGKAEEANQYRNTVFSFLLLAYSAALLLIICGMLLIGRFRNVDNRYVFGFVLSGVLTAVTIIENFGNYRCRIDRGFVYPSVVTLLELLSIPLGCILILRLGYYAIYITAIASMLIGMILFFKPSFSDIELSVNKPLLKTILISGTPLLINGLIWTVVNSIDKFVILGFINTEALGMYGIAQNAFSYMVLIPGAMSQLFYVKMGKEYGAKGQAESLSVSSANYASVLAAVSSILALIAFYFLPLLVNAVMPKYNDGIISSQILIIGLAVYAATLINGNILTILKKNAALLRNSVYMCLFNAFCSISFVKLFGARIESVALGTAVSYIFCAGIIIHQVNKYTKCGLRMLIETSVFPVVLSLVPGVFLYYAMDNVLCGFLFSVILAVLVLVIFFRKEIASACKGKS